MVDVHALERRREPVGVALAADLAVREDVQPDPLEVADRQRRGVVLRRGEERLGHAPQLLRAHARGKRAAQLLAVDQPVRLRVTADDGGRQEHAAKPTTPVQTHGVKTAVLIEENL